MSLTSRIVGSTVAVFAAAGLLAAPAGAAAPAAASTTVAIPIIIRPYPYPFPWPIPHCGPPIYRVVAAPSIYLCPLGR